MHDLRQPVFNTLDFSIGLLQARWQRKELVGETVSVLHRLKRLGKINGFVSIGDTGKLVRELTENEFVSGKVWVVHNDLGGLVQMIERGSEDGVGQFVQIGKSTFKFKILPLDCNCSKIS